MTSAPWSVEPPPGPLLLRIWAQAWDLDPVAGDDLASSEARSAAIWRRAHEGQRCILCGQLATAALIATPKRPPPWPFWVDLDRPCFAALAREGSAWSGSPN